MSRKEKWVIIGTLGIAVIFKLLIALWAALNSEWDLEASVKMKYFLAVVLVELFAIAYILIKVIWLGTPSLLE